MQKDTALLVMDMQASVLLGLSDPKPLLSKVKRAILCAREVSIPVIYIKVGFRAGGPEISLHNKIFGNTKDKLKGIDPAAMLSLHQDIVPLPTELVVVKRRVSAFSGSDLEILLRSQGIQHVILTGMSASGVVLSTVREAADKDYRITVLSDCCGEKDEEVHQVLMEKIFPKQTDVLSLEEWIIQNN